MHTTQNKRCVIVGAGVAGMSAALHCIRNGIQPVVVEARSYVGGRAHSFDESISTEHIDNGQHLMMGCYDAFLSMLRLLGTDNLVQWQDKLQVHFRDTEGRIDVFAARVFSGALGAAEALFRLKHVSMRAKWHASTMMSAIRFGADAHENENALDFLHRHNQDDEMIERLWDPLILATLNAAPSDASARVLCEVLRRSILAGGRASSLIIARTGLSSLFAPFEALVLAQGGEVHRRTEARELLMVQDHCVGIATADETEIRGHACILAIPPRAIARLTREDTHEPACSLPSFMTSPIVSVYMWFDRSFMHEDFCASLGTTVQWVFNRRHMSESRGELLEQYPGHLTLTMSAADAVIAKTPAELIAECLDELHQIFPTARDATLLHAKVIKERSATIRVTPQAELRRPDVRSSVPNVFLAGDWTNTKLPATLEGAAQSGIEAAKAVLLSLSEQ